MGKLTEMMVGALNAIKRNPAPVPQPTPVKMSDFDNALSSNNDDTFLKVITQPGFRLTDRNQTQLSTVLYNAVCEEKCALVETILSIKTLDKTPFLIRVNGADKASLLEAAKKGNTTLVKLLLKNGANANNIFPSKNTTLSVVAGRKGEEQQPEHGEIVSHLLAAMSPESINAQTQDYRTALDWACVHRNRVVVKALVECKSINLSTTFTNKNNVLLNAVRLDWDDIVEIILSKSDGKELINNDDHVGNTPLHLAAKNGNIKITQMLLSHGANANAENDYGSTPLLSLATRAEQKPDDPAIVQVLLREMAPYFVSLEGQNDQTALECAVRNSNHAIILPMVLHKEFDTNLLFEGKTIQQIAEANNWTEIVDALKAKFRVEKWLTRNDEDTLDNQVRDLKLTVIEQNTEIERLNQIIAELKASVSAVCASSSVNTTFRPSVDSSITLTNDQTIQHRNNN